MPIGVILILTFLVGLVIRLSGRKERNAWILSLMVTPVLITLNDFVFLQGAGRAANWPLDCVLGAFVGAFIGCVGVLVASGYVTWNANRLHPSTQLHDLPHVKAPLNKRLSESLSWRELGSQTSSDEALVLQCYSCGAINSRTTPDSDLICSVCGVEMTYKTFKQKLNKSLSGLDIGKVFIIAFTWFNLNLVLSILTAGLLPSLLIELLYYPLRSIFNVSSNYDYSILLKHIAPFICWPLGLIPSFYVMRKFDSLGKRVLSIAANIYLSLFCLILFFNYVANIAKWLLNAQPGG